MPLPTARQSGRSAQNAAPGEPVGSEAGVTGTGSEESGYLALDADSLVRRLGPVGAMRDRLGDPSGWQVREVGDGNLNLVFIVEGQAGAAVVKQALPYVRLVGESWPLPLNRAFFERHALQRQAARCPGRVPRILYHDDGQALTVMEYLTPHVILRKSLAAGRVHPNLAAHMAAFTAETLFRGSDLHMDTSERKADLALFAGNVDLCDITESLVFTDPYYAAELNRHTSPQLDGYVAELRADQDLKVQAQHLKAGFAGNAQTLLHGDLHTGSIMVTTEDTRVIDPEFALYGPMGFDIGMLLANYLMAYFAQAGHEPAPGARDAYRAWLLDLAVQTWAGFAARFRELWRTERTGILYPPALFEAQGHHLAAEKACTDYLHGVWVDAVGYCGVEMHRRILGLAHIAELDDIADEELRAACERKALELGRLLVLSRRSIGGPAEIAALAEAIEARGVPDRAAAGTGAGKGTAT